MEKVLHRYKGYYAVQHTSSHFIVEKHLQVLIIEDKYRLVLCILCLTMLFYYFS